ncbi:hypothetical protein [Absidia glauca]|uniref:Uncharacterized protein n=1 Tax=Absidia glauca TaxID=4829 RepID=A0A168N9C3_ABSGL|nr:hypothetical protein [Absidia glauca]
MDAQKWISQQPANQRTMAKLVKHLECVVIPERIGAPGSISERTVTRFMNDWGYKYRQSNKDVFYDGHELEDVVAYRLDWAKRMMEHKKRMDGYLGDEEEIVSIFYANDGQDKSWYAAHENRLAKKGQGLSVMVSEYQCPCHGTMRDLRDLANIKTSRQLFYPGVNREGYWQRDDMVKQLNDVIPLFDISILTPKVFLFSIKAATTTIFLTMPFMLLE